MRTILRAIAKFRPAKSEAGVTAIEYGLVAALVAVAIVTSVMFFATKMSLTFNQIAARL